MRLPAFLRGIAAALLLGLFAGLTGCAGPQAFPSSADAVDSLVTALRTDDQVRLHKILGPQTDALLSSGDAVDDQNRVGMFLSAYDQKHQLQLQPDGSVLVVVGDTDWPRPVPVVKSKWENTGHFDVKAGQEEIQNRRIGRNELDTMQTCLAIVDAQRDYSTADPEKNRRKTHLRTTFHQRRRQKRMASFGPPRMARIKVPSANSRQPPPARATPTPPATPRRITVISTGFSNPRDPMRPAAHSITSSMAR